MEVILRQKVGKLGAEGDVVTVKPGYARNYLIPKGMAVEATAGNVRMVEAEKELKAASQQRIISAAKATADKLGKLKLSAPVQVGEEDKVFGSVTAITITDMLKEKGFNIDKKDVLLDEPIKSLGVYTIPVRVGHDIEAEVKVYVIKE